MVYHLVRLAGLWSSENACIHWPFAVCSCISALGTASNIFCSKNYEKFGHPFVMGGQKYLPLAFQA